MKCEGLLSLCYKGKMFPTLNQKNPEQRPVTYFFKIYERRFVDCNKTGNVL